MPATSEPAPGSVNAIAARQPSSEASRGSQRCFCSSVPERSSGRTGNIVAPIGAARPAQPHESSSAIRLEVTAATPPPPYSAGIACDVSPSAAAFASSSARAVLALVPLACDRPQLALGELVREVAQFALLGRELEADPVCDAYVHILTLRGRGRPPSGSSRDERPRERMLNLR